MTAYELSKYIELTGIFSTQNVYTVEVINGIMYNMIPSYWKFYIGSGISSEIRIYYTKEKSKKVEIKLGSNKMMDCLLEDITFDKLYQVLFTAVGDHPNFKNWISKVRDYKLLTIGL